MQPVDQRVRSVTMALDGNRISREASPRCSGNRQRILPCGSAAAARSRVAGGRLSRYVGVMRPCRNDSRLRPVPAMTLRVFQKHGLGHESEVNLESTIAKPESAALLLWACQNIRSPDPRGDHRQGPNGIDEADVGVRAGGGPSHLRYRSSGDRHGDKTAETLDAKGRHGLPTGARATGPPAESHSRGSRALVNRMPLNV